MSAQLLPEFLVPAAPGSSAWFKRASDAIVNSVSQESAVTQALIQAFIAVGIALGWWHWSNAQTGAVIGISAALLRMFVRSQLTPLVRPMAAGRPLVWPPEEPEPSSNPASRVPRSPRGSAKPT